MSIQKRMRELRAEYPGSTVEITRGNHLRIRLASGRSVIASATPSDWRVLRKIRQTVRRVERQR